MFQFLLMGAQAAGVGLNLYAQSRAEKFTRMGEDIERQQLQTRMAEEELSSTQQSLFNVTRLREVMATQRAIFGARGQQPGVGSALSLSTSTIGAYNADERARKLSLTFKKNQIESQLSLYGINRAARDFKQGTKLMKQGLNMFSFNSMGQTPGAGSRGANSGGFRGNGSAGQAGSYG